MTTKTSVETSPWARYRLAPGFHLIPSDEHWLLFRPDGRFARLKLDPSLPQAAADLLAGEEALSQNVDPGQLEHLLNALLAQDAIESKTEGEEAPQGPMPNRQRVAFDGEGVVALHLAELLRQGGLKVSPRLDVDAAAASDETPHLVASDEVPHLVVCCADWLPDEHFQQRGAWCAEREVAWHGVYAEGLSYYLGPFWLPDDPRTVCYEDVRARRLAADALPDGLEAYWRYLDAGHRVPDLDPPTPAEAALLAGALAQDILAWSAGRTPPSHGHQLGLDRATGQWRRHPVLPVPRGLMTERIP